MADLQEKESPPPTNAWVGLGVVFIVISVINDLGFKPIGLFAVLIMVTTLITRGGAALKFIGEKSKPPKNRAKPKKTPGSTTQPTIQVQKV